MRLFLTVLRFELRAAMRDRSLPLLLGLFAVALGYAFWNGHRWTEGRAAALEHVQRDVDQQHRQALARFRDAEGRDPARAVSPGALAAGLWYRPALPLAPLAPLAVGQAERFPYETRFHPTNVRAVFAPRPVSLDHPAELAAGHFDPAFVLVTLLPLLLLASCFDAWVRDRETGVARLVLAQPVSVSAVVAAKILARGGSLLTACAALLVAGLLASGLSGGRGIDGSGAAVAVAAVVVYGLAWLGVAAAVNLVVREAAAGALAAGGVWMLMVGLVPAVIAAAVNVLRPAPDVGALVNALRADELDQEAETRVAGSPVAGIAAALERAERQRVRQARLRAPFEAQAERRRHLADRWRFLAPSVALQDSLERLAGHDADRALRFQDQTWEFLGRLHEHIRRPLPELAAGPLDARYAAVPRFAFVEAQDRERSRPLQANLLALLGYCAASLLAAGWAAVRFRRAD